jgi:hypothetical protein
MARLPARRLRTLPKALLRSDDGVSLIEFAYILPVALMLMIGGWDVAHQTYARAVFVGAVERAAREASLETGDTDEADQMVEDTMLLVLPDIQLETERTSYYDFANIDKPEKFTDNKGIDPATGNLRVYPGLNNGVCDDSEPYEDFNDNEEWDTDASSGADSNGGAGDVVMYTVTATYTPLFKVPFAPDLWNERSMTTTAVKKNQPFGDQADPPVRTCTE